MGDAPVEQTHGHNGELHFVRDVQRALLQHLAEVEEHARIPVHTFDEAKPIPHGSDHTLHSQGIPPKTLASVALRALIKAPAQQ